MGGEIDQEEKCKREGKTWTKQGGRSGLRKTGNSSDGSLQRE